MAEIFATSAVVPKKAEQEQYFNKRFYTTKKEIRVNGDTATVFRSCRGSERKSAG
jgi:hypothetical protein